MTGESHLEDALTASGGSGSGESHIKACLDGVGSGQTAGESHIQACLGAAPALLPPCFANLQHWWDFTDQTKVFADVAGTVGITDTAVIQRVDDKGSGVSSGFGPQNLLDAGSTMTWALAPGGSPLPAARKLTPGTAFTSQVLSGAYGQFGQLTFAGVFRMRPAASGDFFRLNSGPTDMNVGSGFGNWTDDHRVNAFRTSNKPVVTDEWVFMRWTDGIITSFYKLRVSGAAEVVQAQNLTTNGSNTPVELLKLPGEIAELLVFDKQFLDPDNVLLETYFITRYAGIFPP